MKYLAVKDYREHQHYRDRHPVWIKLYNRVMDNEEFLSLSDAARSHLILIWLLASRRNNKIPDDAKLVARAIQATGKVNLTALVDAGFLIPWDESLSEPEQFASTRLAEPEQDAMPEGEGELETEQNPSSSPQGFDAVRSLLDRIPEPSRPAWEAEIGAAQQGMHGPALTRKQIQTACRDYLGNGGVERPSLRLFRGYLRGVAPRPDRPSIQPIRPAAPSADGEAGKAFAAIRALIREVPNPGRGMLRTLPKAEVVALGPVVLAAYEQTGGADRFLNQSEQIGFLLRDFTAAFRAASHAGAA